jgi:hypothetical protein
LVVTQDGNFHWGRPYSGRFAQAGTGQIVMSLRENGKFMAAIPVMVSPQGDTLRLTPGSGQSMEFHRVLEVERDSTNGDR